MFQGSWRTTALGIVSGIVMMLQQVQAVLDTDPNTSFSYETFIAGLALLGLGAFSRDNKVTSEQAGAKKLEEPPCGT